MAHRPAADSAASSDWWSIFDPRSSLPARATLLVGGGAALFTVLLAWLAGQTLQRQLDRQAGASLETLAFQISDKLDRAIHARYRELQFAAGLAALRSAESTAEDRRRVLHELHVAASDFAWIGFADNSGRVVAATNGLFEGTSAARQAWFVSGQKGPFVGELRELPDLAQAIPETGGETSRRFLDLAVPVLGADGRALGVIGAHLHWSWAREVQLSVVPTATARRDRVGVTVYAPTREVLLDSEGATGSEPLAPPVLPDSRATRGALLEPTSEGSTFLTGFTRSRGFREYRGLGWLTAVRQPAAIAYAPVEELRRTILGAGLLLSAGLAAIACVFALRHRRRLRSIAAAATRIRGGDVLAVIPSPRGDAEIDRVCREVGDLVEGLRPKPDVSPEADLLARPCRSPVERVQRSI